MFVNDATAAAPARERRLWFKLEQPRTHNYQKSRVFVLETDLAAARSRIKQFAETPEGAWINDMKFDVDSCSSADLRDLDNHFVKKQQLLFITPKRGGVKVQTQVLAA